MNSLHASSARWRREGFPARFFRDILADAEITVPKTGVQRVVENRVWLNFSRNAGIFLTNGGNADKPASAEAIRELSKQPIFVQFVGIGKEDFPFLHKLDELSGRFIDNAGFMHVNDIEAIKDAELYDRLLNEFPQWLTKAREKNLL